MFSLQTPYPSHPASNITAAVSNGTKVSYVVTALRKDPAYINFYVNWGAIHQFSRIILGYTRELVRAICCKSHMRFGASVIWCPTRITSYLFICTKSQMRFSMSAIWCAIPRPFLSFTTRNCAPNCTANRNTILQHRIACYV
jgi:hypothetical protein